MNRFKEIKLKDFVYKSDRILIGIAILILLVLTLVSLNYNKFTGESYYYTECPPAKTNSSYEKQCFNVFYQSNLCGKEIDSDNPLCTKMLLEAGETLGTKAPYLVRNFGLFGALILIITLLLNTLLYNKGFFKYIKEVLKND